MKRFGILTSGGDAPGMNAAIHALTMSALDKNITCIGFERGYNGVLDNDHRHLTAHNVKHISHLGGTILKSARCTRLLEPNYQSIAAANLTALKLDGLVVIGGDGSFKGALAISKQLDLPIIGIPGTIDNDILGCEFTIGFQTAVQTATEAIDKIRDTADALERIFIVEVMGHKSGFIAMNVGIATEAEQIICPEMQLTQETLASGLVQHITEYKNYYGNSSYIIVMAENSQSQSSATDLAQTLEQSLGIECRAVILGHTQRGGQPISQDRILAQQLGQYAIESLLNGFHRHMVGLKGGALCVTPLLDATKYFKTPNAELLATYKTRLT